MSFLRIGLMCLAFTIGPASSALAQTPEEKGLEIAQKEQDAFDGYGTESAEMEMILIDARGGETTRKLTFNVTEVEGDGDRSRIEFLWPADVKGTRMLTWSHGTSADDQWLYLPAMSVVKRISGGNRSGSFMGSEFSYEDFASAEIEKYTYKFLEETDFEGRKIWKYERIPTDSKSGYSRQVIYSDQEYLLPLRIDYYDRKGELLKIATMSGFEKFDQWWRFRQIHVVNQQTKKESKMVASERKLGVQFGENYFESYTLED